MTSLLPDVVRDAVEGRSLYDASESFGVVGLVLLVVLLLELEALRVTHHSGERATVVSAVVPSVLLAVMLAVILRVTELLP